MDSRSKPLYLVKPLHQNNGTNDVWKDIEVLDDFIEPWGQGQAQRTQFRSYYNDKHFFVRYDVEDRSILLYRATDDKLEVVRSDRVEIFFGTDEFLERYFCLEIDPHGRILDYKASYYRDFDYGWSWPEGQLSVRTERSELGYVVELAIGLESLRDLGILKEGTITAGLFRGDCKDTGNPNGKDPEINWISWVDPGTELPDFHQPSAFGQLKLVSPADYR